MARQLVAGLLLSGLSFALPGSDEALQPCGGAFYYPSKVQTFLTFYEATTN